ncbi:MAG TPA: ABC transporter permease, partial [Tissierellaceae bacterium]|nr:ABC transporter permease [Tissierellaceae bacterium]
MGKIEKELNLKEADKKKGIKGISRDSIQRIAALLSLVALFIFFSIAAAPNFLVPQNLINIMMQTTVTGILSLGMTFVLITGGIDLSIGSLIAFSGVMTAVSIGYGASPVIGVIVGILSGVVLGIISGLLISKGKLPPFIASLGMMMFARGLTLLITEGTPLYFQDAPNFKYFSQGKLGAVPYPVIYFIALTILSHFILTKTSIGRYIFATGSNEEAARLSGIPVDRIKTFVYIYSGLFAAIAGIILAARLNSAQPTVGEGYELDAVAAAVIGGTSLVGGEGTIAGTIIGAFIMSVLKNGLNL